MKPLSTIGKLSVLSACAIMATAAFAPAALTQQVTFAPYLQLGDNGKFGTADQIVIAWQTDESSPKVSAYSVNVQESENEKNPNSVVPQARVIDNYLAADPALPQIPEAYGAHSNYIAVLKNSKYNTQ